MKSIFSTNVSLKFTVALVVAAIAAAPQTAHAVKPLTLSSAYIMPGGHISYNLREGYRKFDGINDYLRVENSNPVMFGATVGKRHPLGKRLRIQGVLEGGWGFANDAEFDLPLVQDPTRTTVARLNSNYLTGGISAEAQIIFPVDVRTFFLSAGPGVHVNYFYTTLKSIESNIKVIGYDKKEAICFSPSLTVGAGVEYKISARSAAAISYNFRIMQSASYSEAGALFPMGVEYTEFFYSQMLQFQFLLPGLTGRERFHR